MADKELRRLRILAHESFDPIWKSRRFNLSRGQAYSWLSEEMRVSPDKCHIGMFGKEQCRAVIRLSKKKRGIRLVKIPTRLICNDILDNGT